MSKTQLNLGRLIIEHPDARGRALGEPSRVVLSLFTPGGVMREVPISKRDLLVLAQDATKFALILHDHQKVGQS